MTAGTGRIADPAELAPSAQLDKAAQLDEAARLDKAAQLDKAGPITRRKVFAVGSAGALALGLAACGSSSSGSSSSADVTASAGSDGATATGAAAATSLTKLSAVPVGGAISLDVSGKPMIVSQPTKGTAAAFSAICPHQGCTVAASGTNALNCPCHGSTFDPTTGKCLSGPASGQALSTVAVEVVKGSVVLKA
jgi:nitrite reductase/ring-hydroxylating ferredoxin subunit